MQHVSSNVALISGYYPFRFRKFSLIRLISSSPTVSASASSRTDFVLPIAGSNGAEIEMPRDNRFWWLEIHPEKCSQQQKVAISLLSPRMTNRCKALMRQLICYSPEKGSLFDLLNSWVRRMKPRRNDWLSVLKELKKQENPFYAETAEIALLQDSFESNVRDFTKLLHHYGKLGQLQDVERVLSLMKDLGYVCDQVTLTTLVHIYSKAGNLDKAEEAFKELRFLGEELDRRSYGSIIMAYVRAGMPEKGEEIISEMDDKQIRAGTEVYKALLRSYSMAGNSEGAQRVFNAIQFAGIPPDERICGLLIKAYQMAGEDDKALTTFENMRKSGLKPNEKIVSLVLASYAEENKLKDALDMLIVLEKEGYFLGKEASKVLAQWIGRLGLAKEVEFVLRQSASKLELI